MMNSNIVDKHMKEILMMWGMTWSKVCKEEEKMLAAQASKLKRTKQKTAASEEERKKKAVKVRSFSELEWDKMGVVYSKLV